MVIYTKILTVLCVDNNITIKHLRLYCSYQVTEWIINILQIIEKLYINIIAVVQV